MRSSQIEGTASDIDDVLTFEATGSDEGLPPDVVVTLNYVKALEYGLGKVTQNGVRALDPELIKKLHARLMEGVSGYADRPGELRARQNWLDQGPEDLRREVRPPSAGLSQGVPGGPGARAPVCPGRG